MLTLKDQKYIKDLLEFLGQEYPYSVIIRDLKNREETLKKWEENKKEREQKQKIADEIIAKFNERVKKFESKINTVERLKENLIWYQDLNYELSQIKYPPMELSSENIIKILFFIIESFEKRK